MRTDTCTLLPITALLAGLAIAGCGGPAAPEQKVVASFEIADVPPLDLLFVVDNSGSMEDEQSALLAGFPDFVAALERFGGGLPDLHIGVVTTDLGVGAASAIQGCTEIGDGGVLQNQPRGECEGPTDRFIEDVALADGTRQRNYAGTLADAFSCIAPVGVQGCGFEQPLEAMRRALDGSVADNAGFLRDDAVLAVVVISDEDDCSTADPRMFEDPAATVESELGPLSSFRCFEFGVVCEPVDAREPGVRRECRPREESPFMFGVQPYVDFLRDLKGEAGVFIGAITGDATPVAVQLNGDGEPELAPSCIAAAGAPTERSAAPAVRLSALADAFPLRNVQESICGAKFDAPLADLGQLLTSTAGHACLAGDLHDTDDETPGLQVACDAVLVEDGAVTADVPACADPANAGSSPEPCHVIAVDQDACDRADGNLAVTFYRGDSAIPSGARFLARCLVDA